MFCFGIKNHIQNVHPSEAPCGPKGEPSPETCDSDKTKQKSPDKHDKARHKCQDKNCAMTFRLKSKMMAHYRRVHLKVKPYVCDKCGKSFADLGPLREHQAQLTCNFWTSKTNIADCAKCPKKFNTMKNYLVHYKKVHGGFPENMSNVGEQFICEICSQVYMTSCGLGKHKRLKHQMQSCTTIAF